MKSLDDQLFSVISHDLKSPFNSLIGFTELLKNNFEKYDDSKKKQIIDILHKTTLDAYRLVDNLLLWWRSDRDQLNFSPEKIVLYDFVNKNMEEFKKVAAGKEIVLHNQIPDDIIVEADKEMLRAIVLNLISNAIKYTSKKGEVWVKAVKTPSSLEIVVQDTGVGIPEEIKDKLFTFDKEVVRIGTANEKGTGLGLAICKTLVEKHGGSIRIQEAQSGAIFVFSLPVNTFKSEENNTAGNFVKNKKTTILIAEDDEANYFLLDTLLKEYDMELEVIHVANGKEAVTVANTIPDISLILMDMKMPIMDGYEATLLIKEMHPDLPIIAQTAYTSREDKEKSFDAGCDAIISKPIDAAKLHEKIMDLLRK